MNDERMAHRAAVEAGYASLSGYLEKYGNEPDSVEMPDDGKYAHIAMPLAVLGCLAFWALVAAWAFA